MPDFEAEVGRLIRASIDAVMVADDWQITDHAYMKVFMSVAVVARVSRPGANGAGGGALTWTERYDPQSFSCVAPAGYENLQFPDFEHVRSTIHTIVDPWRRIPKGSEFETSAALYGRVTGLLGGVTPAGQAGAVGQSGTVIGSLEQASQDMNGLQGVAFAAFEQRFLVHLKAVLGNLAAVSLSVQAALTVEKELWGRASDDALQAISETANSMGAVAAKRAAARKELVLSVLGAIGAAGATIAAGSAYSAPGVVSGGIAGGVVLVTDLAGAVGRYQAAIDGASFDPIIASLQTSLEATNRTIADTERAAASAASQTIEFVSLNGSTFDLAYVDIPESGGPSPIRVDDVAGSEVVAHFGAAASSLRAVYDEQVAGPSPTAGSRPAQIGIGATGPTEQICGLAASLSLHLKSTLETMAIGTLGLSLTLAEFAKIDDDNGKRGQELVAYLETLS